MRAYCFTSDLDWANESMIEYILNIFKDEDIPLTPFITHISKIIENNYRGKMHKVGLHPNFLPSSSHGKTYDEVISHVISLNPDSKFFRSHSFFDNTIITDVFKEKGFKFDSNLCLYLQNNIIPLQHNSGMLRLPVFLEDDSYMRNKPDFKIETLKKQILSDGLKIFNFHPVHICENKKMENFLRDLISFLNKMQGLGFYYLTDIYEMALNGDFK